MKYLKTLLLSLKKLFSSKKGELIPISLGSDEIVTRAILHPLFYSDSKRKLKREAFLPPPGRKDVSVLRLKFTSDHSCKRHARSLSYKGQTYRGLATLLVDVLSRINELVNSVVKVSIIGSALDSKGNSISGKKVYSNSPGLPMHADILYSEPVAVGKVQTEHRLIADCMVKNSNFFLDPNPDMAAWQGPTLSYTYPEET
ncbi:MULTISPECIES: hypothetical protein [unclassified Imperialibacter]|uniref:hypothetical protein n=1 Tax=unclassified Imperialibacter TaxID=2629706 RepID=UPI0012549E74|nr:MULTISPECIES: hypothetical protein [unclassified Imperialibacter]CAD5270648.1 conserved hypothetical protein [Imperialibacter sp. 89]CAD5298346.1 conserved hypothetical protein [Imperialibacter sp. 75]VVT34875.1 conserved hypothetical protein [Imperialibacter sp. EC-SDR9]